MARFVALSLNNQRKGLGIGGRHDAAEVPWYVTGKDLERNVLIVAQGHDHPALLHDSLETGHIHWIDPQQPAPAQCSAKIRSRQPDQPCRIVSRTDDRAVIRFDRPQRAITPGQSIVFYRDEVCLGGGVIETMYNWRTEQDLTTR